MGFSSHAATRAGADDEKGREALLKYILRPPLATEWLLPDSDGLVRSLRAAKLTPNAPGRRAVGDARDVDFPGESDFGRHRTRGAARSAAEGDGTRWRFCRYRSAQNAV